MSNRICYMGILKCDSNPPIELCSEYDLRASCFTRDSFQEIMAFLIGQVVLKTGPGMREAIHKKGWVIHSYRVKGVCGIVVSNEGYPLLTACAFLSKICDEFHTNYSQAAYANVKLQDVNSTPPLSFPQLKDYIKQSQDLEKDNPKEDSSEDLSPKQVNSLETIQKELKDTLEVAEKTFEQLLERGETIDALVAKSDRLSAQSKMFYQQSKRQNSCCEVM